MKMIVELIIYLFPCLMQIYVFYMLLHRDRQTDRFFGLIAFILLVFGLIFLIAAFSRFSILQGLHLFIIARICLIVGCLFWAAEQILWIKHRVRILG